VPGPLSPWAAAQLSRVFVVAPATLEALSELPRLFLAEAPESRIEELEPATAAPPAGVRLKEQLGPGAFLWLCGCAVHPELDWNLVLQIGKLPAFQNAATAANLQALVRLPFFRTGRIPEELRLELAAGLTEEQEHEVRALLLDLIRTEKPLPRDSAAEAARALAEAVQSWALGRNARRQVLGAMRQARREDVVRYPEALGAIARTSFIPRLAARGRIPALRLRPIVLGGALVLAAAGARWSLDSLTPPPVEAGMYVQKPAPAAALRYRASSAPASTRTPLDVMHACALKTSAKTAPKRPDFEQQLVADVLPDTPALNRFASCFLAASEREGGASAWLISIDFDPAAGTFGDLHRQYLARLNDAGYVFTLEAMGAKHGASMLLHAGRGNQRQLLLFDGGPAGVYQEAIRPRLLELKQQWSPRAALPLAGVFVTNINDDHIRGILDLLDDLAKAGGSPPFQVEAFWHNLALEASYSIRPASIRQARDAAQRARQLGLRVNPQHPQGVLAGARLTLSGGLTVTVLNPTAERLRELLDEERKYQRQQTAPALFQRALYEPGHGAGLLRPAAYVDAAVPNRAATAVLLEYRGKRMLLSSDARGDYVLAALQTAGLMRDGRIHVDLLAVPHHGSNRSVAARFFQQITADHYVIPADGTHDNPDIDTLRWLFQARGADPYTVWFTSPDLRNPQTGRDLKTDIVRLAAENFSPRRVLAFPSPSQLSIAIDLFDPVR
jgi:hypothetical protein